jgi:iron complex outermembrane receptor protein
MRKRLTLLISTFIFVFSSTVAQETRNDSTELAGDTLSLENVVIRAFGSADFAGNIAAGINRISARITNRFAPFSLVHAVNSTAGVRMEERSPGSYRINVRGSSLRSPFGVRNVKIYYNDLPFTNPGGHSFLNQLGVNNFKTIEIIKGPGSSFYGAGTGGVMLINPMDSFELPGYTASVAAGSFGNLQTYAAYSSNNGSVISRIAYERNQTDGYRQHSKMQRDVFSWHGLFHLPKAKLKTTFLYGDLYYQTPGALTRTEYEKDPKASRPGSAVFPSAIAANASVKQRSFLTGLTYEKPLGKNWNNLSALYGMFTELKNPNIQAYDKSSEPHFGGRTEFSFTHALRQNVFRINLGAEYQAGFTAVSIYKNRAGNADSLRSADDIDTRNGFLFAQATLRHHTWSFTLGSSVNFLTIDFERSSPNEILKMKKRFTNTVKPRFAVMKKFRTLNLYAAIAKGFSPPTNGEFFPTGGLVNTNLQPEKGTNYEMGLKGSIARNIFIDINPFVFHLDEIIVQGRTASGGDYYNNAGDTRQFGIETSLRYEYQSGSLVRNTWLNYAWSDFYYQYKPTSTGVLDGEKLPSVPQHALSAGIDHEFLKGFNGSAAYSYISKIPLNDANTAYADPYHLLTLKLSYEKTLWKKTSLKISAGSENLLDEKYSLGNDVNAFGGRHYNAAPGRSFYASFVVKIQQVK